VTSLMEGDRDPPGVGPGRATASQDLGAGQGGAPAADVSWEQPAKREPMNMVTFRLRNPHSRRTAPAELVPERF